MNANGTKPKTMISNIWKFLLLFTFFETFHKTLLTWKMSLRVAIIVTFSFLKSTQHGTQWFIPSWGKAYNLNRTKQIKRLNFWAAKYTEVDSHIVNHGVRVTIVKMIFYFLFIYFCLLSKEIIYFFCFVVCCWYKSFFIINLFCTEKDGK